MESQKQMSLEYNDLISKIRRSIDGKNRVKLDKFVFLQRLGGGSYGDVYKAIHSQTEKYFAIKIIDKQMLLKKNKDPYVREVLQRLLKSQGPLMQQCNSPHVVKCYDIKENQRHKIFILQFCNRGSLHDELKKRKAYPVNDALAILKQIIIGLAQLHKNRIIHRDLKAENIMIHNGKYKIADFGFSKQIDKENSISQHTVLGTKMTMAPQVKLNQKYGIKADIWSLGIIFFTMICSDVAYESQMGAGRSLKIQQQIALGKQSFFETVDGHPDSQLKEFIKQMLTIDQRYRISWRQLINHKIFERTNARIFENPIMNVKITEIGVKDKESEDEQMLAKEHQQRLFVIGNKQQQLMQLKQQNLLIAKQNTPNLAQNSTLVINTTNNAQDNSTSYNKIHDSNSNPNHHLAIAITIQIDPISNLSQQYYPKSDIDKTIFHLIQLNNLQCHKAQYIYEKLILKLQHHQMLNLNKRSHHQLIYLLITRCWVNVSWVVNNLDKFKNNQMMLNYHQQLKLLYTKIQLKWNQIQQNLLNIENSIKYMLKDVGCSVFDRRAHQILKKFITGIQTEAYTKSEQIQYTQTVYIEKIVNQLKGKQADVFQMKRRLLAYKRVNEISLQKLQERGDTFDQRVRNVMMY